MAVQAAVVTEEVAATAGVAAGGWLGGEVVKGEEKGAEAKQAERVAAAAMEVLVAVMEVAVVAAAMKMAMVAATAGEGTAVQQPDQWKRRSRGGPTGGTAAWPEQCPAWVWETCMHVMS